MKTRDDNSPSAKRGEPSTFIGDVKAEMKAICNSPANRKLSRDMIIEAIKAVPVVGDIAALTEKFIQGIAGVEREERLKRLEAYLLGLGQGYDEDTELREEDLLPVIKKLATDDENTKTGYYVRLTRKLGRMDISEMSQDHRLHFIHTVSSLTRYQIDFARELKIRQTFPVLGTASFEESELALTGKDSGIVMKAVRTLQNAGLLKEIIPPPRAKKPEGILYDTTSDFTTLMGLLFHPGDFEPETVGLQRKEVSDLIIVGKTRFIDNLYGTYLPAALKKAGFNAKIVESNDKHLTTDWAPLYLHTGPEGDGHNRKRKLYLTREGLAPYMSKGENLVSISFEESVYLRDKSSNKREADHFRKQMDLVVNAVRRQLDDLPSPA